MRIIGGRFRGTVLASVGTGDAVAHLRPTSDRVREAIFNLLAHGDYPLVEGARVLDLFAGTGALGFEALSRGAASVTFVDDGAKAHALIRANADKLRLTSELSLLRLDATRLGQCPGVPFDLIFLDPPYGRGLGENALVAALAGDWVAETAMAVWEESTAVTWPAGFRETAARRYGETHIHIGKRA